MTKEEKHTLAGYAAFWGIVVSLIVVSALLPVVGTVIAGAILVVGVGLPIAIMLLTGL